MAESRLAYLFTRQVQKKCTEAEREELMLLLADQANEDQAKELLGAAWENFYPDKQFFSSLQSERILQAVLAADHHVNNKFNRFGAWFKYAAVAAVLLLMFSAVYFYYGRHSNTTLVGAHQDIAPGINAATLKLASGRTIFLTDTVTGKVAEEAGVNITKTAGGQVVYHISDFSRAEVKSMNTISTAKGEQYQIVLPDGTKVWLNAASSVKFPVSFVKRKERRVELNGEAFFEVARDKKHPFIVETEQQKVKVLGTHFNISAYGDEKTVKTTLVEGSVQVSGKTEKEIKILKPGQQSLITAEHIEVNSKADLEDVLAWKNGYFKFNESLESSMNKIARWYNIEVVYEVNPDGMGFEGKISRNKSLSVLLKNIETAGGIHFKIEGRRVTVIK